MPDLGNCAAADECHGADNPFPRSPSPTPAGAPGARTSVGPQGASASTRQEAPRTQAPPPRKRNRGPNARRAGREAARMPPVKVVIALARSLAGLCLWARLPGPGLRRNHRIGNESVHDPGGAATLTSAMTWNGTTTLQERERKRRRTTSAAATTPGSSPSISPPGSSAITHASPACELAEFSIGRCPAGFAGRHSGTPRRRHRRRHRKLRLCADVQHDAPSRRSVADRILGTARRGADIRAPGRSHRQRLRTGRRKFADIPPAAIRQRAQVHAVGCAGIAGARFTAVHPAAARLRPLRSLRMLLRTGGDRGK